MAGTVGEWADQAATLPAALVRATPRAVTAGAEALEDASRANLLADSGGDLRLSRVRSGKGATIALRIRTVGTGSRTRAEVVPTGPVMLLEGDTRKHRQPFSYGTGRRYAMAGEQLAGGGTARRRKAARRGQVTRRGLIYVPGLGMFQHVNHPGTTGKRPVGRAFDEHHEAAGRAGVSVFAETARRHLTN